MKVNGWTLLAHPAFLEQYNKLITTVEELEKQEPEKYQLHPSTKLLKSIQELVYRRIPLDPTAQEFRQGTTLGQDKKYWFRAKFHQRFRLFFRYNMTSQVIIYGWVNDEKSLRKAGVKTDPYRIFARMLERGYPPNNWNELLQESSNLNEPSDESPDL
ncbi:type II toxin-antitoxin system YhaV family toxin [Scytonema sp. NUACC26]